MKICPTCGQMSPDNEIFCRNCGTSIAAVQSQPNQEPVAQPAEMNQPVYPPYMAPRNPKKFTWFDVSTLVGFVSSIVGLFWSSILLLPLAVVTSVIGFKGNKTKGLAVAGIVISVIGILIKICFVLYNTGIIPAWFTNGIFS